MRVSNVDKLTKEGELPVRLCNYIDVYKDDRITERLAFMQATATPEELERFRLQAGDVLITKDSEMWNDIGVPALVEYIASDLVCGYHLALLRPRSGHMIGDYLLRALQSPGVAYQFHVSANGVTRYGLSHDAIKTVLLPLPPPDEQSTIVRYLDYVDRRIRRYIRAKQKLIALLNEQKQAIIHQAVTRGLDPNVRLKPSGVVWLGEVPEHWEVVPIKRAFVSMDYGISESATNDGTIRLLTMGNIKDGRVTIPQTGGVTAVDTSLLLVAGDLLFNRTNSAELVGKVGLFRGADSAVTFASYLVRMRPHPEHEPEYLNLVLNDVSALSMARREAIPSLHQSNLNPTRYGRLNISLPPVDEQRAILQYLPIFRYSLKGVCVKWPFGTDFRALSPKSTQKLGAHF
jgi:type I restriction enzyme S subunit